MTSPSRAKTSAGGNPGSSVSDVPSCYPGTLEARRAHAQSGFLDFSVASDHSAADMAAGGCSYAATIDVVHTRAACVPDLRDHAVRLMKRRGRHCLGGGCDG